MREGEPHAITIAILAMGGEGGGVLADWIVDVAEHSGYYAQTTSVPGVAQRTGSTIYYLELFPEAAVRDAGKEPVLALMPVPGEVDIVIASELMEAGRAVQRGLVTPDRTTLIASTNRVYSMTEKTVTGDGRADSTALIEAAGREAKTFLHGDFAAIAEEHGSLISAVLFGALASTGALPFECGQFEDSIRRGGVGVPSSLDAFAAGLNAAVVKAEIDAEVRVCNGALASRIEADFPAGCHDVLFAGVQRLADYQDARYAAEYLDRLDAVRAVDAQGELLRETGRYLALWMSYEDAIRVADLKIRRERFERVHREARVGAGQVLKIHEFLHPRVQEIADILPAWLGRWLLGTAWARRLVERYTQHGRTVETTSLGGYMQLYALARLRPLRRRSLRFRVEQRKMGEWLATVLDVAREDYALALEVAECPRLVKGYGDTHRRGSESFDALMGALPKLRQARDGAAQMKRLREAALLRVE